MPTRQVKETLRMSPRSTSCVREEIIMATKSASRWSGEVTKHSNAPDLEKDVFKSRNPDAIAASLKHSAETSDRRKSSPYRSAVSMLTFNRAGGNLSEPRRRTLGRAKASLRRMFYRDEA